MRTLLFALAALVVWGCADDRTERAAEKPIAEVTKKSAPLTEPVAPKKAEPPAYTNAQLAGVYKMVYSKEEVAAANANGLDITKDVPTITFKADGTFVMGSTGSPSTTDKGTFRVEGKEMQLTLVAAPGQAPRKSPRIKVLDGGKAIEFASGVNGRTLRLERT